MGDSGIERYKRMAGQCERKAVSLTLRKRNISKSLRASGANWPNALNAQENSPPTSRAVDPYEQELAHDGWKEIGRSSLAGSCARI
jgi:hypothetical protein